MSSRKRFTTVLEATVVTALTWIAYKTMKVAEPGGFNCSPGLAMLLAACFLLLLHRRNFTSFGIAGGKWCLGVNLGAAFTVLMLLGGAIELALVPVAFHQSSHGFDLLATGVHALRIPLYLALFFLLMQPRCHQALAAVPVACTLSLLIVLIVAAPAYSVFRGAPVTKVAGWTGSLVFFTTFGEEGFFRGYVQSSANEAFGRPWRFLGASRGPGLFVSAFLFGLIHVFNPTKPYEGHWEFSWSWGVSAFVGGLLYGYLRELTGTIWTAAIVHALGGEYKGLWQVFLANS